MLDDGGKQLLWRYGEKMLSSSQQIQVGVTIKMPHSWLHRFEEFFSCPIIQKKLTRMLHAKSARELWLQGEMYCHFTEEDMEQALQEKYKTDKERPCFAVNHKIKVEDSSGKSAKRAYDLAFRNWDYDKKVWGDTIQMAAEIKFLGYGYQPKGIYGGSLKTLLAPKNTDTQTTINITPDFLKNELPGNLSNSLVRDYQRLLELKNVDERYLILVCSRWKEKKPTVMKRILDQIEFPGGVKLMLEEPKYRIKIWKIEE